MGGVTQSIAKIAAPIIGYATGGTAGAFLGSAIGGLFQQGQDQAAALPPPPPPATVPSPEVPKVVETTSSATAPKEVASAQETIITSQAARRRSQLQDQTLFNLNTATEDNLTLTKNLLGL